MPKVGKECSVGDQVFGSRSEMAQSCGVSLSSFNGMVKKLGSDEATYAYYQQKKQDTETFVVNGIECHTFSEAYSALGLTISRASFFEYVKLHGLCKAVEHYLKVGGDGAYASIERYTLGDKKGIGLKDAVSMAHTSANTVRRRAKETGKSKQEVLTELYNQWLNNADLSLINNSEPTRRS